MHLTHRKVFLLVMLLALLLAGCYRPLPRYQVGQDPVLVATQSLINGNDSTPTNGIAQDPIATNLPPTESTPRSLPTLRSEAVEYIVQSGDTLAKIALTYGVSVYQIMIENNLINPNLIEVGQFLVIPPVVFTEKGPSFKIIPDSELVYGPFTANFNVEDFVNNSGGYLSKYSELLDEEFLSGAQIVLRVAQENSINPRILLAVLDYQGDWVSRVSPESVYNDYPLGYFDPWYQGLYGQLSWAANELNRGFYLWQDNKLAVWTLSDNTVVGIDADINAGTAALQYFMGLLSDQSQWQIAVSENGFTKTYQKLFGNPFVFAYDPLLPDGLVQPVMTLPFKIGDVWLLTSGPHGGWNGGSAWAALDFAPPGEAYGCFPSATYVVSSTDGRVVRTGNGAVVVDLDGDGFEQTGWTILYMHIATEGRIVEGTILQP
ncbi:MAG: LysM peptidoglycan-binding domain-containing protein, partial [Anaerolineaceae bacterium]|nr:LysM peptidoglycan-binding domain-containing protein [Anaerolineaceae bacterium]